MVEDGEIEREEGRRVVSRRIGRSRERLHSSDDRDLPDEVPASLAVHSSEEDPVALVEESDVVGGTSDVDDSVDEGFAKFEEGFGDEEEVGDTFEVVMGGGRMIGLVSKEGMLEDPLNDLDGEPCEATNEKNQFRG